MRDHNLNHYYTGFGGGDKNEPDSLATQPTPWPDSHVGHGVGGGACAMTPQGVSAPIFGENLMLVLHA